MQRSAAENKKLGESVYKNMSDAVPFEEVEDDVPPLTAIDAVALRVEPRKVQVLLNLLSEECARHSQQTEQCAHLKRVKKLLRNAEESSSHERASLLVLLGLRSDCIVAECLQEASTGNVSSFRARLTQTLCSSELCQDVNNLTDQSELPLVNVQVPSRAPLSAEEFDKWNYLVWPFAVPKPHKKSTSLMVQSEKLFHESVLRDVVWPMVTCLSSSSDSCIGIAAAVVDPGTKQILAKAVSSCSRKNRIGAMPYSLVGCYDSEADAVVLEHPVMSVLKHVSQRASGREPNESSLSLKQQRQQQQNAATDTKIETAHDASSYLASRLDVYVTHEPCSMCSMALVHSRVGRVFYTHRNPADGALGSRFKVHTLTQTNHRFLVYRGVCAAEFAQWEDPCVVTQP